MHKTALTFDQDSSLTWRLSVDVGGNDGVQSGVISGASVNTGLNTNAPLLEKNPTGSH